MPIVRNSETFTDVVEDTLEFSKFGSDQLYLTGRTEVGSNEVYFRFGPEETIAIRDHLLKLFPLDIDPAKVPSPIVLDFTELENRIMAVLTKGGATVTINATGNVIVNNK